MTNNLTLKDRKETIFTRYQELLKLNNLQSEQLKKTVTDQTQWQNQINMAIEYGQMMEDEAAQTQELLFEMQSLQQTLDRKTAELAAMHDELQQSRQEYNRERLHNRDLETGAAEPKRFKRYRSRLWFWRLVIILLTLVIAVLLCFPNLTPYSLQILHQQQPIDTAISNVKLNLDLAKLISFESNSSATPMATVAPTATAIESSTVLSALATATPILTPTFTPAPQVTAAPTFSQDDCFISMNGIILNLKGWQNVVCDSSRYQMASEPKAGQTSYQIVWKEGLDFEDLWQFTLSK